MISDIGYNLIQTGFVKNSIELDLKTNKTQMILINIYSTEKLKFELILNA